MFKLDLDKAEEPEIKWHPTPVLLPRKSHGQRSLVGCSPWGHYSQTQLSDFTFTFHFHALEKEMATHSSVIPWRIPGTGKPGGLLSTGLHRVRHDWATELNWTVVPCPVLTVASWLAYRFLKRQVRWSGIPISWRIFHSLLWSTQSKALA